MENGEVTFRYRDYKKGGEVQSVVLAVMEFIRRFALHILPHGFARMGHYGLLSSRGQAVHLPVVQAGMGIRRPKRPKAGLRALALQRLKADNTCPCCGHGGLTRLFPFPRGGPPDEVFIWKLVLDL